jgi:hypothetical protein
MSIFLTTRLLISVCVPRQNRGNLILVLETPWKSWNFKMASWKSLGIQISMLFKYDWLQNAKLNSLHIASVDYNSYCYHLTVILIVKTCRLWQNSFCLILQNLIYIVNWKRKKKSMFVRVYSTSPDLFSDYHNKHFVNDLTNWTNYIDIILCKCLMICMIKTFKNVLSIKFGC